MKVLKLLLLLQCVYFVYGQDSVFLVPEILVSGNGVEIVDGDITPSIVDHTDFGPVTVGGTLTRTFRITNTGGAVLELTNDPPVQVVPLGVPFTVAMLGTNFNINPGAFIDFTLTYTSINPNNNACMVTIANNDPDESPYTFMVKARGVAPEIKVSGNGVVIDNDDDTPSLLDHTDFGPVAVGASVTRTFLIENIGAGTLNLTLAPPIMTSDIHFDVTSGLVLSIPPTSSSAFTVRFTPTAAGEVTAEVQLYNNDPDESDFHFNVRGTGVIAPEIDLQRPAGTAIADSSVDFYGGCRAGTVQRSYTVDNTLGNAPLTLSLPTAVNLNNVSDFIVTTLPPASIPAAASDTFSIQFSVGTGQFAFDMNIANNDTDENPYDILVRGFGIGPEIDVQRPAGVSIADGGTDDLGGLTPPRTSSHIYTYVIENQSSNSGMLIDTLAISNQNNIYEIIIPKKPPAVISELDQSDFVISFRIGTAGAFGFDMQIGSDDVDENPYDIHVTGNCIFPAMALYNAADVLIPHRGADMVGNYPIGRVNMTYTVNNSAGTDTLIVMQPVASSLINVSGFTITDTVTTIIDVGDSDTLGIAFDVGLGPFSLKLSMRNNDNICYRIYISGIGVPAPEIDVQWPLGHSIADLDTLEYGTRLVGADTLELHIDNSAGTGPLNVTGLAITNPKGMGAVHALSTLPMHIPPGDADTLAVAVTIAAEGDYAFDMALAHNDADEDPYDIHVRGTGIKPEIEVRHLGLPVLSGGVYDFGPCCMRRPTSAVSMWILNLGTADLHLGLPHTITGHMSDQFILTTPTPQATVLPGDSVLILVQFQPMTLGVKTATLNILSDDADESPYQITLSGRGTNYPLTIFARPIAGGTTFPAPFTYWFDHGSVVPILARPAPGYRFLRWDGYDIADPSSASTTIQVFWQNHAIAFFEPLNGDASPSLCYCYPVDSAAFVPKNSRIQFRTGDAGRGVDLNTLSAWVDDVPILLNGEDQTGGQVGIRPELTEYSVIYTPPVHFDEDSTVTVRVCFDDLDASPLSCDSSWAFTIGCTCVDTATCSFSWIGELGGTLINEDLGITMTVPMGALMDTVQVSISAIDSLPPLPDTMTGYGMNYHFGPDGLQANAPIVVAVPYTQEDLDAAGVASAADLEIHYFHSSTGQWMTLEIDHVDASAHLIYVKVMQFCILTFANTCVPDNTDVDDLDKVDHPPFTFQLQQNFPNPFNPETTIAFEIPCAGHVSLQIYDINGRLVKKVVDGKMAAGRHSVSWTALDDKGNCLPSGVYLYQLISGNTAIKKKMLLMK